MSVPRSSRCVAKLWRREWSVSPGLRMPAASTASWNRRLNWRGVTGANAIAGEDPALRRLCLGVVPHWAFAPPLSQREHIRRQHDVAILAAFRLDDADNVLRAVNVADRQPRHLAGPEPAAVADRQHRPGLQARRHRENALDLVWAQHDRHLLRLLDVVDLGREIVPPQCHFQEELHAGHDPVAIADGEPFALD